MHRRLLRLVTGLTSAASLVVPSTAWAGEDSNRVTLCHATSSPTNPYVEITVSGASFYTGHRLHLDDIYPSGSYANGGHSYSWAAHGDQSLLATGCVAGGGDSGDGDTGDGGTGDGGTGEDPVPLPESHPAASLDKTVTDADGDGFASEDEVLTYGFSVTNTGDAPLSDVTITDAMIPALSGGALCVPDLAVGETTTCPALPAATHTVTAAEAARNRIDNAAVVTAKATAGQVVTTVSAADTATIGTAAPVVPPADPTKPFDWNWTYEDPTCSALTVDYPANIPDGQANDVNVRIRTADGDLTLNFHDNDGFWSGRKSFPYGAHPQWPAGLTDYTVVWTQVGGTNYHWQGAVPCTVTDDGDPTTPAVPKAVTTIDGWRTTTLTVAKGSTVSPDAVSVGQLGTQSLTLQRQAGTAWRSVGRVATHAGTARVTFGRQTHRGTFRYRLAVPGSEDVTGAATAPFTVRVR